MSKSKIDYGCPISEQIALNNFKSAALSGNLEELEPLTRNQTIQTFKPYDILEQVFSSGQIETVKMLINRECFSQLHDDNYKRLELAITSGNFELAQILLEKITDLYSLDLYKQVPILFKIVHFFSIDSDEFPLFLDNLLEKGVDIDATLENDFTILHYAAKKGNVKFILLLLKKGCWINSRSKRGSTPLHIAVKNGHLEVVKLLLNNGADDTVFNNNKMTPLYLAVENQDFNIFKILYEFSRCSQTLNKQLLPKADHYETLKTGKSILYIAVEKGNLEIFNELFNELSIFERDFKKVDSEGFTPLHVACAKGNFQIICALLDINKFELDARSNTGLTALHLAAKAGHLEVVTLLLKRGADFKIADQNGRTPLSFAIESTKGDAKTLETLLIYIRRFKNDKNGCFSTPEDQVLLEYHSLARKDEIGNSALHLAVQKKDAAAVVLLLKHKTCVDALNKNRQSPLDLATINGSLFIVNIFLQSRDNPQSLIVPKEENGYTPMHFAVENGKTDVLELFIKAGISVNISKPKFLTPLHIAVEKSNKDLILFLLKNGAKVDAPGLTDFETPLFTAAENGNAEVLEILLKASTNFSTTKFPVLDEGYLPMYIAAYNGHEKVVKLLLDLGVNPNANLDYYLTPLHTAAQKGHADIVKLLLERGAQVDPRRLNRWSYFSTPLLAAFHGGHSGIVRLLLEHGANCNEYLTLAEGWEYNDDSYDWDVEVVNYNRSKSKQILMQGSYKDSEVGREGSLLLYSPLYFAVEAGDEANVKLLIKNGADVYSQDSGRRTAIGLAIEKEDKAVIKHFLSSGINFNQLSHKRKSIFQIENLKTNLNLAMLLIDYAIRDQGDPIISSLRIAVDNDLENCVKNLLETQADEFIQHKISDIQALFRLALEKSSPQVVEVFLNFGFSIDMTDEKGNSPLFYAVDGTNLRVVYFLLRKGASVKTTMDKGRTILDCAVSCLDSKYKVESKMAFSWDSYFNCDYTLQKDRDKKRIVRLLIDYGADVYSVLEDINIETVMKSCLLNTIDPNYLSRHIKDKLLKLALDNLDCNAVKLLILNGANVDVCNEYKSNYTTKYRWDILYLLIEENARQLSVNNVIIEKISNNIHANFEKYYYERCQEEIKRMKTTNISENISYFDVLVANYDELVHFTNVRDIRLIILRQNEVNTLFPVYAEFLINRIAIASDRRRLLTSSYPLLRKILRYDFPPLIVEAIFDFLSNSDLKNLNTAFIDDMFDEELYETVKMQKLKL